MKIKLPSFPRYNCSQLTSLYSTEFMSYSYRDAAWGFFETMIAFL